MKELGGGGSSKIDVQPDSVADAQLLELERLRRLAARRMDLFMRGPASLGSITVDVPRGWL